MSLVGYFYEDLFNFFCRIEGVLSILFWVLFGYVDKLIFNMNKNVEIIEIIGYLFFVIYSFVFVLVVMNFFIVMFSNIFKKVFVSISNL